MGVIQSSINSMIGTAGNLAALAKIKDNTDKSLELQEEGINQRKRYGDNVKELQPFFPGLKEGESLEEYGKRTRAEEAEKASRESMEVALQKKVRLAEVKRRNFARDYLPMMETSLGGKVGQFEKPIQKQIASQFSQAQRKQIMDQMDAEAKEKEKKNGIKK